MGIGRKLLRREEIDHVANTSNSQHYRYLLPFSLVDDAETKRKDRDEEEAIVLVHRVGAGRRRGGVGVHKTVDSGADCDAEAEKQ